MARVMGVALSLVLASWIVACGGDDGTSCTTSADCTSGRCVDGTCLAVPDGGGCVDSDCDDGNTCNGTETCGPIACQAGSAPANGTTCDADGDPSTMEVCLAGTCAPARCGDGVLDMATGEECDDANDVSGDGCDDCRYSCTDHPSCDDGNECNGTETCNTSTHVCATGTALADGADCAGSVGTCLAGSCVPKSCTMASECDDANACTGVEACTDMACVAGMPLDCDDANACTGDTCGPALGCSHVLIDGDRDGHPPSTLGACGDDCDDANPLIYGGSADGCDGLDNDCDTLIDEDEATIWYADCDGDNFAPMGGTSITACARPATSLTGCPSGTGAWVSRAPSDAANADCNDANALAFPTQTIYQSAAIAGAAPEVDFDYNCNGTEEPSLTGVGACVPLSLFACRPSPAGWVGAVPECGATGMYFTTCVRTGGTCTPNATTRVQSCR